MIYLAASALFLAAKVEEQPRPIEHIIKALLICQHNYQPKLDTKSEQYKRHFQEIVDNENILLQTLGFDVAIDHPHTHVVKCCKLIKVTKELSQISYHMATYSLTLTTMCVRHPPTVVACVCVHLACKWSQFQIPVSREGKPWFWYLDTTVSMDLIEQLTLEFLNIIDIGPSKVKRKIDEMR